MPKKKNENKKTVRAELSAELEGEERKKWIALVEGVGLNKANAFRKLLECFGDTGKVQYAIDMLETGYKGLSDKKEDKENKKDEEIKLEAK